MKYIFSIFFIAFSSCVTAQNFTQEEREQILSGDTATQLRVTPLNEPAGEKALRALSKDIAFDDPLLPLLKKRMYLSLTDPNNPGVGIAAPQVGINRNLIWVKRFDKKDAPFQFFINPKIVWRSDLLRKGMEGDLSFADKKGEVVRHYTIMISYTDEEGQQQIEILEDFTSVIFQHETDHLFGTLLFDRLEEQKKNKYKTYHSPRSSELLFLDDL